MQKRNLLFANVFCNFSTSGVSTNAHCNLKISFPLKYNISPFPINCSAPGESKNRSRIYRRNYSKGCSCWEIGFNHPCNDVYRWSLSRYNQVNLLLLPIGPIWQLGVLLFPAVMIRSANSSTTRTM